ncbi:TetR/AcrR family transcriptional regulator [Microbacterium sp. JB110]|uniref:TetR/AcrR family transcriptional regulator n=1 Tax=Microbacterium sp. JB110 TaxID=2024477 RepID=UPI001BAE69F1|nr:TetR family transcriptional regulator [Microbacterium sp. JB110]
MIATAALRIAGAEGFPALTMRRLAEEFGVTVRALYNHVSDRQEVIDLVAAEMTNAIPAHDFDPQHWEDSFRQMYREGRAFYRQHPRAALISLTETVTLTTVPISRILSTERMLAFLTGIGLRLEDAVAVRGLFLVDIFGYTLLIDDRNDRSDDATRREHSAPVPAPWLDVHRDLDVPLSRAALDLELGTNDDHFEVMIERALGHVRRLRQSGAASSSSR